MYRRCKGGDGIVKKIAHNRIATYLCYADLKRARQFCWEDK